MSDIKWLPDALADIQRLDAFLRNKNPKAADRAIRVIMEGADLLKTSPYLGRAMDDASQKRELYLSFSSGAYVLRYKIDHEDNIIVIRVWHNRENRNA